MINNWFAGLNPVAQAFLATCFTCLVTAFGARVIFVFKDMSRSVLDAMLRFAAGVMIYRMREFSAAIQ